MYRYYMMFKLNESISSQYVLLLGWSKDVNSTILSL